MTLSTAVTMESGHTYAPLRGFAALATQYTTGVAAGIPFKIKYIDTYIVDRRPGNTGDTNSINYNKHKKVKTWFFNAAGVQLARPVYIYRAYLDKRAEPITSAYLFPSTLTSSISAGTVTAAGTITHVGANYIYGVTTAAINPSSEIFRFTVPNMATDAASALDISITSLAGDFVTGSAYTYITHRIVDATAIATFKRNTSLNYPAGTAVATGDIIVVSYIESTKTFSLFLSTDLETPVATVVLPSTISGDVKIRIAYQSTVASPVVNTFVIGSPTGLILPTNLVGGVLYKVTTGSTFTYKGATITNNAIVQYNGAESAITVL